MCIAIYQLLTEWGLFTICVCTETKTKPKIIRFFFFYEKKDTPVPSILLYLIFSVKYNSIFISGISIIIKDFLPWLNSAVLVI